MSERLEVHFPSGDAKCQAWLYLPEGPQPRPVIVMTLSTDMRNGRSRARSRSGT